MLEIDTPFDGFTMSMFTKKVVNEGVRPLVNDKWSIEIQTLLRNSWGDIHNRPNMIDVCEIIRQELSRIKDEDVKEFTDVSRKSEASMHNLRKSVVSSRKLNAASTTKNTNNDMEC